MDIKNTLMAFLSWRKNNRWGWIETVLITGLALVFFHAINPQNPLYFKEVFPWPWLVAVIIVLQYGFGPGILSLVLITGSAVLQRNSTMLSVSDFQHYVLSGIILLLVCGLFSSSWIRRMLNAESLNAYTDERLKSLSRSYYMLRISYDYLENNLVTKPMTLRLAFAELEKITMDENNAVTPEAAYGFLQIISQFCSVNVMGIYRYENKIVSTIPFAEIGAMGQLIEGDPLVQQCLSSNAMVYASINQIDDLTQCNYLMVHPLMLDNEKALGLLVIKEMPFWNLNEEFLRTLVILVAYFTHDVVRSDEVQDFLMDFPDCNVDFAKQLIKLLALKKSENFNSALVAVMVSKSLDRHNVIYQLKNQHRLLDSYWATTQGDYEVLITLMPFTEATGIHGYTTRIRNYLTMDQGLPVDNETIKIRTMQLYEDSPRVVMEYFYRFIQGNPRVN